MISEDILVFNGIDGTSGEYLIKPSGPHEFAQYALQEKVSRSQLSELIYRDTVHKQPDYAPVPEVDDPSDLSQSGWGVIFPADADASLVESIQEAINPLLEHRQQQAGDKFRIYKGADGYRKKETKDEFLKRHGSGPGPVNPLIIPYYILLVGDPHSIPYEFQYELDVQFAVGRIHFNDLRDFASYAISVVLAERGFSDLSPEAVFFGVVNKGDRATQFSSKSLILPLHEYVDNLSEKLNWSSKLIAPENASKSTLLEILGGKSTPAFLFTASHGLGFPNGHNLQIPFQGALLCDTSGPIPVGAPVSRDYYLGGEDVSDEAKLHGLIAFHFACFGAGTPQYDDYSKRKFTTPQPIAPYSFLSTLPKKLLCHPNGGALAVIGHIDRAWSYSIKWGDAGGQTEAFKGVLFKLFKGKTIGEAMDYLNLRYAEIATMLNTAQSSSRYETIDEYKLAGLWTANNDARGYTIIGDPAVKTANVFEKSTEQQLSEISIQDLPTGDVPVILVGEDILDRDSEMSIQVGPDMNEYLTDILTDTSDYRGTQLSVLESWVALSQRFDEEEIEAYGLRDDVTVKAKEIYTAMTKALSGIASRLAELADDVSGLEVETYVSSDMGNLTYEGGFNEGAQKRAITHINIDGDTQSCVPMSAGELDESLWLIHNHMVEQAMKNRLEMVKAATEMLANLISPPK